MRPASTLPAMPASMVNDANNNAKLIADLQPIRKQNPNAPIKGMFVCVLALVRHADDPLPIIAQGLWQGEILDAPHGDGGFGYDPLFWLPQLEATAASLDSVIKTKSVIADKRLGNYCSNYEVLVIYLSLFASNFKANIRLGKQIAFTLISR